MIFSVLLVLSQVAAWGSFGFVAWSPAVETAYRDVVALVSLGEQHLTGEALRSLFNMLENRVQCGEVSCEKCNLTEGIHQLISQPSILEVHKSGTTRNGSGDVAVSVSEFSAFAAGCVLFLTSPSLVCHAVRDGKWREETEHFLHKITHHDHHHEDHRSQQEHEHKHIDVHGLKIVFGDLSDHYEALHSQNCVTPSAIMTEVNVAAVDQRAEVAAVLGRVLYHGLRGDCFVGRSLPEESFFLDYIMKRLGSENFTAEDLEGLMRSLNLGPIDQYEYDHHDDGHVGHDHSGQRRRKRSIHAHHESNITWDQQCFSGDELILIYNLTSGSSTSTSLHRSDFAQLSPALVQQILSGACRATGEMLDPDQLTKTERYIFATIANVVITLTSLFGIVVLLCTSCSSVFQLCIQFCISLAVGSLTGDALLHLLPMFLGLHVHPDSHSVHQQDPPIYILRMLLLMSGIYLFYLMETIFSLITRKDKQQSHHHHHHHEEEAETHHCDHGKILEMYQQEKKHKDKSQSTSKTDLVCVEDKDKPNPKERTREQRMLPYMITIGDGIHNFADGLAIGAAFSLSWRSGLATSLAVLCHELPHELGDFAILLYSGLSVRKALLLNVGSAMSSFVGLYIALSVATDLATQQWIAAITAGLFLYVGLADMLPTMVHISHRKPWLMFALQNVGLLTGWVILLILSLYEEQISF
ncbi:zinc transporter ZIP4 [Thalassophryne amazonica]|uniref:zinc transporter ZIP4 n=1 Tax=Thalassophryne amazonica TaxID=390379 RepID=UPI0014715689|nr:zinc transporter ZIP4 [Thalassophryne amazonica]